MLVDRLANEVEEFLVSRTSRVSEFFGMEFVKSAGQQRGRLAAEIGQDSERQEKVGPA